MAWLFSYKFALANARKMHDCLVDLISRLILEFKNLKAFS